jgi:hypothetical protein
MKAKNLIFAICILLFTSCVVKSLHPFYTKKTISFDKNFIGEWKDDDDGKWKIVPFIDIFLEGNKTSTKDTIEKKGSNKIKAEITKKELSKEDKKIYDKYEYSYYIERKYKGKEVIFLATPFKINDQTFLDFLPFDNQEKVNNLLESHSIYTHSLVKYDVQENREIKIKWLDENKVEKLFEDKKIKIKHEKIGLLDEKYLLTAKSEELQKFIKKYISSNDDEKWKTSTKFTLSKINATN